MNSFLHLQQCPPCLVRLTLIIFVMSYSWPCTCCFMGVAPRTCSMLHAAFLCNCRQAFSPYVHVVHPYSNIDTTTAWKNCVIFFAFTQLRSENCIIRYTKKHFPEYEKKKFSLIFTDLFSVMCGL